MTHQQDRDARYNEAWHAGADAAHEGQPITDCPNYSDEGERFWWRYGYLHG